MTCSLPAEFYFLKEKTISNSIFVLRFKTYVAAECCNVSLWERHVCPAVRLGLFCWVCMFILCVYGLSHISSHVPKTCEKLIGDCRCDFMASCFLSALWWTNDHSRVQPAFTHCQLPATLSLMKRSDGSNWKCFNFSFFFFLNWG